MKGNRVYALSLESGIKNIISETLGPTDIDYEIDIDETADKKNCLHHMQKEYDTDCNRRNQ